MTDDADAPDDGPGSEPAEGGGAGEPRRKRRRRRRGGGGAGADASAGASAPAPGTTPAGEAPRERRAYAQVHGPREASGAAEPASAPPDAAANDATANDATSGAATAGAAAPEPRGGEREGARRERRRRSRDRDREPRADRRDVDARTANREPRPDRGARTENRDRDREPRAENRDREPRAETREPRAENRDREPRAENRDRDGRGNRERRGERRARGDNGDPTARDREAPAPPVPPHDDDSLDATDPAPAAWGTDDDGPAPAITLAADLPPDPPADDDDPVSHPQADAPSAQLGDVVSACAVRFVAGGRTTWFDAGDATWAVGDPVIVDSDRGARVGWIAIAPTRRPAAGRDRLRRVIRRASDVDLRGERDGDAERARALRVAKDRAAALRLPLKVFRVELSGQLGRGAKLHVYYTSDDRLDLRELITTLSRELGARVELRQLGVRDEAKAVGGIGSCGLTLCCTTWLPDFVPVSIKMAKDQGLVLSPTKVSGQCGRLKCCLVYEQAGYAELRKGLPKLGKRVIGARGEGRVVEVDVLHQRVRVSYGPGDTEVVPASEVRPMFPPGNPRGTPEPEPDPELADPGALSDLAELPEVDPSRDD